MTRVGAIQLPVRKEPEKIRLDEVTALSALEKLRLAYQALGFFTAEHPLWNQPTFLNADTNQDLPLTIAEAAAHVETISKTAVATKRRGEMSAEISSHFR